MSAELYHCKDQLFCEIHKDLSSNNTPKNSNLNNETKVYNGSGKSVSHFFPCEIKTLFKIALKIQFSQGQCRHI